MTQWLIMPILWIAVFICCYYYSKITTITPQRIFDTNVTIGREEFDNALLMRIAMHKPRATFVSLQTNDNGIETIFFYSGGSSTARSRLWCEGAHLWITHNIFNQIFRKHYTIRLFLLAQLCVEHPMDIFLLLRQWMFSLVVVIPLADDHIPVYDDARGIPIHKPICDYMNHSNSLL